jgi:hypothetical protein
VRWDRRGKVRRSRKGGRGWFSVICESDRPSAVSFRPPSLLLLSQALLLASFIFVPYPLFLPDHLLPLTSSTTPASTITGTNLGFHISISLSSHPGHSTTTNRQNRNNPTQPLDCYKQVDSFKNIVGKLEKVSLESLFLFSSFSLSLFLSLSPGIAFFRPRWFCTSSC